MRTVRFNLEQATAADEAFGGSFNCGPGAACAVLKLTPMEILPFMGDFKEKGYTNPTLMTDILRRAGADFRQTYRSDEPVQRLPPLGHGVVRIQWGGPWTKPGVPMRVRYRQTHWIAVADNEVFDINAICVGGWIDAPQWCNKLAPWLIKEAVPKGDGTWWPTHAIAVKEWPNEERLTPCKTNYMPNL